MQQVYDFRTKLEVSKIRQDRDISVLWRVFPQARHIRPGSETEDKKGSDYIVDIGPFWRKVDVKAREPGCSRFWSKDDTGEPLPELAIELVSVHGARTGWALDWAKHTDYLMFTFDPTDWPYCYVVPALAIRQMTERFESYMRRNFQVSMQTSGLWTSECVFVPINKIAEGIVASWKFRYAEEQAS